MQVCACSELCGIGSLPRLLYCVWRAHSQMRRNYNPNVKLFLTWICPQNEIFAPRKIWGTPQFVLLQMYMSSNWSHFYSSPVPPPTLSHPCTPPPHTPPRCVVEALATSSSTLSTLLSVAVTLSCSAWIIATRAWEEERREWTRETQPVAGPALSHQLHQCTMGKSANLIFMVGRVFSYKFFVEGEDRLKGTL